MTMTIPTIPSLPAGHLVTVAEMNQLAAACTFLLTKPMARIRDAAGGQAIGTTAVVVTIGTTDFDLDGMTGVHANSLTVATPGWYKLRYTVNVTSAAPQSTQVVARSVTGPNNPLGSGINSAGYWGNNIISTAQAGSGGATGLWPFYLYAGDYIQILAAAAVASVITTTTTNEGSSLSLELVSI